MPIRLIYGGLAALVALLAGGVAFATNLIVRKLADKKVAILGAQQVGKTTLLMVLRDGKVPRRVSNTVDPAPGGSFSLAVGKKEVRFQVPKDIPGNDALSFPIWKQAFEEADYVWYLFRADLLGQSDLVTNSLVSYHLDEIGDWARQARGRKPKIILIGTFADKAPAYAESVAALQNAVASSESIKVAMVKLKGSKLVVGSLLQDKDATSLIKRLRSNL